MKIVFSPSVFKKFPQLQVFFLFARDIDNSKALKESQDLVRDIAALVRQTFHADTLKTHHLLSPWNIARQGFGRKAKHYQTSLETLLRKASQGKKVISGNVLENIVTFISLKHLVPLSSDDAKFVRAPITFTVAGKDLIPLKKKGKMTKEEKVLLRGDFFYHDRQGILGAKLDFFKSKRTGLSKKTTAAMVHGEILPPLKEEEIQTVNQELVQLIQNFCGGKISLALADKKHRTFHL